MATYLALAAAGVNSTDSIVPSSLKFAIDSEGISATFGDASPYTFAHGFGTTKLYDLEIYETSSGDVVQMQITKGASNASITFSPVQAAGYFTVISHKTKF